MKTKHSRHSPLSSLLTQGALGSLVAQAVQSGQLETLIKTMPELRGIAFSFGPVQNGNIKMFVSTPSALTRLRQMLPTIQSRLQSAGIDVKQITLKIQTTTRVTTTRAAKPSKKPLPATAAKAWLELERQLTDSPILEATRKLCKHHNFK